MFILFLIFCTIVLFLCLTVIWCICWLVARLCHHTLPYAPFAYIRLTLVALFLCTMLYGYWFGRKQLLITETTYTSSQVPAAFDGYKIVHFSDLHISSLADSPAFLQRVIDTINAQQPDLICFTGDFVSFGVEEAFPFTNIFRQMHSKDGIMSVLGNHDFALYSHGLTYEEKDAKVEQLTAYQRDTLGWHLLRNQAHVITRDTDKLQIMGVDNASCQAQGFQTVYRADMPKVIEEANRQLDEDAKGNVMKILLSHDPSHWRIEVVEALNIPLTLSGHTHAGQFKVFGYPISSLMFNESEGWYHEGNQSLYINTGIGCTLPVRIGVPAEITLITLRAN